MTINTQNSLFTCLWTEFYRNNTNTGGFELFDFDKNLIDMSEKALEMCEPYFKDIEKTTKINQHKMLKAFIDSGVSESHFSSSTGYGYNDRGRDVLDKVYAKAFGCEDALVRHSFANGTHAITTALFGILRPGDSILSITGIPYDTMHDVIGIEKNSSGSLKEFNINFEFINLLQDGKFNYNEIISKIENHKYKAIYIQRSKGYTLRKSLSVDEISQACEIIKHKDPEIIIITDNCYGEFVEENEPTQCGSDIIAGSLIKNPGGGIAPSGGYIAGKKQLIEMCSYRLTVPGAGREVGASLGNNRELFLGAFNSPHVTGEALKTAVFTAALFECMGYDVYPKYFEKRNDIIQSIKLGDPNLLIEFCKGIQKGSPVDSFVSPEPWDMPGYSNKVIMAAGTFTSGSSIELSADAPLREPYSVWVQGGINFESAQIGILSAAQNIIRYLKK